MAYYIKKVFGYLKQGFLAIRNLFSKLLAYFLFVELTFVYYATCTTLGKIIFPFIFIFGCFGNEPKNTFQIICWFYIIELLQAGLTFWIGFRSPRFRDWFYSHLNREKVDKMVYSSPAMGAFVSMLGRSAGPIIGVNAAVHGIELAGHGIQYSVGTTGANTRKANADAAAYDRFNKFTEMGEDRKTGEEILKKALDANTVKLDKTLDAVQEAYNKSSANSGSILVKAVDSITRTNTIDAVSKGVKAVWWPFS